MDRTLAVDLDTGPFAVDLKVPIGVVRHIPVLPLAIKVVELLPSLENPLVAILGQEDVRDALGSLRLPFGQNGQRVLGQGDGTPFVGLEGEGKDGLSACPILDLKDSTFEVYVGPREREGLSNPDGCGVEDAIQASPSQGRRHVLEPQILVGLDVVPSTDRTLWLLALGERVLIGQIPPYRHLEDRAASADKAGPAPCTEFLITVQVVELIPDEQVGLFLAGVLDPFARPKVVEQAPDGVPVRFHRRGANVRFLEPEEVPTEFAKAVIARAILGAELPEFLRLGGLEVFGLPPSTEGFRVPLPLAVEVRKAKPPTAP